MEGTKVQFKVKNIFTGDIQLMCTAHMMETTNCKTSSDYEVKEITKSPYFCVYSRKDNQCTNSTT